MEKIKTKHIVIILTCVLGFLLIFSDIMVVFSVYSGGNTPIVNLATSISVTQSGNQISITNTSQSNDCFVRVKIIFPTRINYTVIADSNWKKDDDGYWYYSPVLEPGKTASGLSIEVTTNDNKEFNHSVITESCPCLYDEKGNPYADWNVKYTDYTE